MTNARTLPGLADLDPTVYDRTVTRAGGEELAMLRATARDRREALYDQFDDAQRAAFNDYLDATTDYSATREDVAARVAFTQGVGVGAAWARYPDQDPDALAGVAQHVHTAIRATSLPDDVAEQVATMALGLLTSRA